MKFPILKDENVATPLNGRCPQCKRRGVGEPNSFAVLEGGALLMDRNRRNGGPDARLDGFLNITWHGAHDTGIGVDRDIHEHIDLATDCRDGQFEVYFCSTACLRKFLNSWVDALEARVGRERRANTKRKPSGKPRRPRA